jgi:hypothetical protein
LTGGGGGWWVLGVGRGLVRSVSRAWYARAALRCAVHAGGDGKMHKETSETLCRDAPGDGVAADTSSHQRRVLLRGYVLAADCQSLPASSKVASGGHNSNLFIAGRGTATNLCTTLSTQISGSMSLLCFADSCTDLSFICAGTSSTTSTLNEPFQSLIGCLLLGKWSICASRLISAANISTIAPYRAPRATFFTFLAAVR